MARRKVADTQHLRSDLDLKTLVKVKSLRRWEKLTTWATETVALLSRIPVAGAVINLLRSITPLGWGLTLIGGAATLAGLVNGWAEAVVVGLLALTLVTVAIGWSLGRAGHAVSLELGRSRVTVGERAMGQLVVSNPTSRSLGAVRVELQVGLGATSFVSPALPAGSQHEEVFGIATSRRGVVTVGPASAVRGDALGLVRRVQKWSQSTELYIHPRTVHMASATVGFIRDIEGATTQDLSSSDVSFHALRDYVAGDDRRNIHWRTTARVGKLMVRQFEETRRSHLLIVLDLDVDSWGSEEEFETGVSAAASLARATMGESKEVSIRTQAGPLKTATAQHALDSLAGVERVLGAERLITLAHKAGVETAQASTAVLITGSRLGMSDMHAALSRLPMGMVIAGARIDATQPMELRTLGGMPVVSVPSLDEFSIAMWKALR